MGGIATIIFDVSWEHPLIIGKLIFFTTNNERHASILFLGLAFLNMLSRWYTLLSKD
jgi:hypothetical protein